MKAPNILNWIPKPRLFWIPVLLFAGIYFARSGLIRVGLIAGRDTVAIVGPDLQASVAEIGQYTPGAPRVQIVIGDRTYQLIGAKDPGAQYVALFGAGASAASSGFTTAGSSGGTTAETVSQLAQGVQTGNLTPEQRGQQFNNLVHAYVQIVGGQDVVPDYTSLEPFELETARATLAAIKALNFDVVNPPRWEAELEDRVAANYVVCFKSQDLDCVTKWGVLQTRVINDTAGLAEWIGVLLTTDNSAFTRLVSVAVNTNASDIANRLIADAFNTAKTSRIETAKAAVKAGNPTALDIQWAFAGQTVTIVVDEGFDLPQEVGGSRGVIDDDDKVTVTDQSGNSYVIPAMVVKVAIPSLTPATTSAIFSPLPVLWDQNAEPYVPGQPLP